MGETHSETTQQAITAIIERHKTAAGPLLPILHDIQNQLGYVPESAVAIIARALNLSRAEVHGVITFYHHFATQPRGAHVIEVCRAESCQAMGGRQLEAYAKESLGLDWHQTSRNGQFTLEPVYCLGNCACSPSVRVGNTILGRVDRDKFDQLIDTLATETINVSGLEAGK